MMTWCIFASDQSDLKIFHKLSRMTLLTNTANWFKIEKDINYEDIISQLKPYNLLLNVSNEPFNFLEKVRRAT